MSGVDCVIPPIIHDTYMTIANTINIIEKTKPVKDIKQLPINEFIRKFATKGRMKYK